MNLFLGKDAIYNLPSYHGVPIREIEMLKSAHQPLVKYRQQERVAQVIRLAFRKDYSHLSERDMAREIARAAIKAMSAPKPVKKS